MPAVLIRTAVCAGFTWERLGERNSEPYIFSGIVSYIYCPSTWGTEDWWSDGREERVTGNIRERMVTFFLFYRREQTKG